MEQDVLEAHLNPTYTTPIVPILKPSGDIWLCADKCTINKILQKDPYQIPALNQLLATLAGGKIFAKLDLVQAYQ